MSELLRLHEPALLARTDLVYAFPGQGAHEAGMGYDFYDTSPAARAVFNECNLGFQEAVAKEPAYANGRTPVPSLYDICGSEDALKFTANAQPAIVTVSLMALAAAMEAGAPKPTWVAGHSLGEYTALVAADVIKPAQATYLTRIRGRLMQEASPPGVSTMAAIQDLDEDVLREICEETGAEIANYNSPVQLVISGKRLAVVRAMEHSLARGARKVTELGVAAGFHSGEMAGIVPEFDEATKAVNYQDAKIQLVSNVTGQVALNGEEIRKNSVKQVTRSVLWMQSVQYMHARNARVMVEIGPGRVLTGLNKRIVKDMTGINVNKVDKVGELASL